MLGLFHTARRHAMGSFEHASDSMCQRYGEFVVHGVYKKFQKGTGVLV